MVDITKHPPHNLINNINSKERIKAANAMAKDIGHVCYRSAIDYSKNPRPRSMAEAIASLVG